RQRAYAARRGGRGWRQDREARRLRIGDQCGLEWAGHVADDAHGREGGGHHPTLERLESGPHTASRLAGNDPGLDLAQGRSPWCWLAGVGTIGSGGIRTGRAAREGTDLPLSLEDRRGTRKEFPGIAIRGMLR